MMRDVFRLGLMQTLWLLGGAFLLVGETDAVGPLGPWNIKFSASFSIEGLGQPSGIQSSTTNVDCREVGKQNQSDRCSFIRHNPNCKMDSGFLNYLNGIFCIFPAALQPLAITLYVVWLLYLFVILGVTAEKFFCPNLSAISTKLRLAHNVAGVTFLAFGNGAPDIFSAVVAFSDPRTAGLAIGAIFGAGIFVTTIVAGGIALIRPFTAASRPFLRDAIFYMVAVFLTFVALYFEQVTLAEALSFLGLYIFYVLTVVVSTWLHKRQRRERLAPPSHPEPEISTDSEEGDNASVNGEEEYQLLLPLEETTFQILTQSINPLDYRKWRRKPCYWKLFKVCKLPVELVLLLTVPTVDPDRDDQNWKRPLNCLHLITGPLVCILTLKSGTSVCLPGILCQRHVDQRCGHRGGEHPADFRHHLPSQQHSLGLDPARLGKQRRGHVLRPHHGAARLPPNGFFGLFWGYHLQYACWRRAGLPFANVEQQMGSQA
ncbi:mitochondrial sodium/calcium exchanger protein isoform X2 [Crotalus tigris]|uniref:mitochondrial sodium/calcium exchanger protein isoform X2 n=1 Tax=Crotalus tigris TaxID=88082 RepID=UPI00192F8ACB|nr:mitochondrial sodium/calcium exchanger protein isoform X2 [Crotalus tigris]